MKMPGADKAVVGVPKVRDYLLSQEHLVGRFKASFFAALGYRQGNWKELQAALQKLALAEDATPALESDYGRKFETRAILEGPSGRRAEVVAIWIILNGEDFPRFITAYPGESE